MVRGTFLVGCDELDSDLDRGAERPGEMPDDLLRDSSKSRVYRPGCSVIAPWTRRTDWSVAASG
jgi:hypothetical protein